MKRPSVLVYSTQMMTSGGIESHLQQFCLHMSAAGIDVDLAVPNSAMSQDAERRLRAACRTVLLGHTGRSTWRQLIWMVGTALRLGSHRYGALYTNGQGQSVRLIARAVPRWDRWVHHHHMAAEPAEQAGWHSGYVAAMRDADTLIACSRSSADQLEVALEREVDVIPCFSRQLIRSEDRRARGPIRLGYYGRLVKEKGIDDLCRMSQDPAMAQIELHIWGEGADYPATFFDQFPTLHFHGPFDGESGLRIAMETLDGYLLLSRHPEGLPISLLEAMGAGLPWLATDRGGIPEIAAESMTARVIPSNSTYEERREAVLHFADDLLHDRVPTAAQQAAYQSSYSSRVLVTSWSHGLGLDQG